MALKQVPEYVIKPRFTCKCSMDKVYRTIALVPREEMLQILADRGQVRTHTHTHTHTHLHTHAYTRSLSGNQTRLCPMASSGYHVTCTLLAIEPITITITITVVITITITITITPTYITITAIIRLLLLLLLLLVGRRALILLWHEQVEVKCEFCKRDYVLEGKELEEAYAQSENKDAE